MKTSVNMVRKMGQFDVTQRTKDGFFNATEFVNQWNSVNSDSKKIVDFMKLKNTKEFTSALEEDISQNEKSILGDYKVLTLIKGRNTSSGKTADTYWLHPYLYIKFAMWLNPRFEVQVIKFVHDQLIALRNESGDLTKDLNRSVQVFSNIDYKILSKGINYIIFGKHFSDIRNTATPDQAKELVELQKKLSFAVDMGYIKSFEELINEMRRMWHHKQIK